MGSGICHTKNFLEYVTVYTLFSFVFGVIDLRKYTPGKNLRTKKTDKNLIQTMCPKIRYQISS